MEEASSSEVKALPLPPQHQVFVNFRGEELRNSFVSHLRSALVRHGVNIFIDTNEQKGKPLHVFFQRIEESRIALAIFSVRYTESKWCLNELVKMKECMDKGKLLIIPIFYKVKAYEVRYQKGRFGYVFKNLRNADVHQKNQWSEALSSVADRIGFSFDGKSDENNFINGIVEDVKEALSKILLDKTKDAFVYHSKNTSMSSGSEKHEIYGLKQRLEELKEKLDLDCEETRILGVVGMPGIGKTTLAREIYETLRCKFLRHGLIQDIRRTSKELGLDCLPALLLEELLGVRIPDIESTRCAYESYKMELYTHKVLVVLDDVSDKEQIDVLLGRCDWIRQGSRIVIATSDKSLIQDVADYTYVVPQLNHKDGLGHFARYAFDHHSNIHNNEVIMKLSKEFVHYGRGHPLVLKLLGADLNGKDEDHWKTKLATLAENSSQNIRDVLQVSYDELSQEHKDIFLDIACFRSEDESYIASLLDSSEAASEIKALMNKFMINVSEDRVEMHDLLYTFARELCRRAYTQDERGPHRLWHHQDITGVLKNIEEGAEVRGIFLNMNEMKREMSLDSYTFKPMHGLRYLKIYSSHCPQQCKPNNKINLPDGLNFPLNEVRYLHWLQFPLKEIPPDFNPRNLVDLMLPHSKIERIWSNDKDKGSDSEPLFSICFPGSELPSWFCHEAVGPVLELRMPPHWHENRLAGVALCAVVSFPKSEEHINCFSVKCTFKLEVKEGSWIEFSFPVGRWSNQGNIVENIASEHVFIGYISWSKIFKRLENQHFSSSNPSKSTQSSKCSPTKASLNFMVIDGTSEIPRIEVLKCGLRFFKGAGSSGNYLKKLEVKEAEQNLSAEKVSEDCTHVVKTCPEQSQETVTTEVEASPEKADNAEFQINITPREGEAQPQPRPCSKTSKWACFTCCDFQKLL
ncbi:P-loop containing nucleoside triphosphate hydrolase [Arabidopsis thaliana x Arabidopsis arenosa]|uniref:ADP-ribosyl cyclase/cyclic ADP-ribose hydrolase n=2 Tax=Arabidopsis TaxID=3701 RepID=A0A8T1ZPB6_9BRAS|nr:P-loop containing nucleoside triphosphate hydrolase [Arabidopsis thaliana x Arabidopsis arenosa]